MQEIWTEADFDRMSWHDNHVHGIRLVAGTEHGMSSVSQTKFSPLLSLGLVAPLIVATGAWFVQYFARFPPRSLCASLTAVAFLAVPLIEILAVPVAVTTLIRRPELRTVMNVSLTILCSFVLLAAAFPVTLIFRS